MSKKSQKSNTEVNALDTYRNALASAIDARITYERDEKKNESIIAKLNKLKTDMCCEAVARVMLAANVDANFINRSARSTARYNIYAAQKVENIARALLNAERLNHYSRAILLTAQKMQNADTLITHEDAKVACSVSAKSRDAKRQALIVQYQKHTDASTASTQSSSSLNALMTFNVLRATRDAMNNECFAIVDNEHAQALIAQQ